MAIPSSTSYTAITNNNDNLPFQVTGTSNAPAPEYWFHLVNSDPVYPFDVLGYLPEQFHLSTGSTWEQSSTDIFQILKGVTGIAGSFTKGLGKAIEVTGEAAGAIADLGGTLLGINYQTDFFNTQIWKSTPATAFGLQVHFEAYDDALNDVWRPMNLLQSLTAPIALVNTDDNSLTSSAAKAATFITNQTGVKTHILRPPSTVPKLGGGKSNISIRIGNMFYYEDVIVKGVQNIYNTRLDSTYNLPISGMCDIQFETRRMINFQDQLVAAGFETPQPQKGTAPASGS